MNQLLLALFGAALLLSSAASAQNSQDLPGCPRRAAAFSGRCGSAAAAAKEAPQAASPAGGLPSATAANSGTETAKLGWAGGTEIGHAGVCANERRTRAAAERPTRWRRASTASECRSIWWT